MTEWDGRGLPPGARRRLDRFGQGSARTSLLTVGGAVGAESVGMRPVGEVMGSIVEHIGWQGWGGCGYFGGLGGGLGVFSSTTVTSGQSGFAGYGPYVDALYRGYDTAIGRMLEEALALRADGVIDVRLVVDHIDGSREFMALGTAVQVESHSRPARLFCTQQSGQEVAALIRGGFVPVSISYGLAVAIRHDDYRTRMQQSSWANTEVSGYTELVHYVRADARAQLARRVAATGADGCVGVRMSMQIREIEPSENHRDHVAEVAVFGDAVARFGPPVPPPDEKPLILLPLRRL